MRKAARRHQPDLSALLIRLRFCSAEKWIGSPGRSGRGYYLEWLFSLLIGGNMEDEELARLDREIDELFLPGPEPISPRNLWRRQYRKRPEVRARENAYARGYVQTRRSTDPEWREGRNQARRTWYRAKCNSL